MITIFKVKELIRSILGKKKPERKVVFLGV